MKIQRVAKFKVASPTEYQAVATQANALTEETLIGFKRLPTIQTAGGSSVLIFSEILLPNDGDTDIDLNLTYEAGVSSFRRLTDAGPGNTIQGTRNAAGAKCTWDLQMYTADRWFTLPLLSIDVYAPGNGDVAAHGPANQFGNLTSVNAQIQVFIPQKDNRPIIFPPNVLLRLFPKHTNTDVELVLPESATSLLFTGMTIIMHG